MIRKIFLALAAKVIPTPNVSEVPQVQEKPAPTPTRRFMPARIELQPSHELITMLRGAPCTTMRIIRPSDSGPWLHIVHVDILPDQWGDVGETYIHYFANKHQVETSDLRKAVNELCLER